MFLAEQVDSYLGGRKYFRIFGKLFCLLWIVVSNVSFDRHVMLVDFLLYRLEETFKCEVWKHSVGPRQSWRLLFHPHHLTKCPPVLQSSCVTACQQDFVFFIPRQQAGGLDLLHCLILPELSGQEVSSALWVTCWKQMPRRGNCFLAWRDRNMRMGETRTCWDGWNWAWELWLVCWEAVDS